MHVRQINAVVLVGAFLLVGCSSDQRHVAAEEPGAPASSGAAAPALANGVVIGTVPFSDGTRTFVLLSPQDVRDMAPPAVKPIMDQIQLSFIPNALIVRSGFPVEFRSSDEELHNINVKDSRTREQAFNVAIPPDGRFEYTFKNPGFYDVNCDIHSAMSAQILVAATPHVMMAGPDGSFAFHDVAPGAYRLTAYSGARTLEQTLQVTAGQNEVQMAAE
jgi:plastocyanin